MYLLVNCILLFFILFASYASSEPLTYQIPFERGREYRYVWLILSIESGVGVVLNIMSMDLFMSLGDSTKVSFYALNVALNLIDLIFVISFFFKTTLSYITNNFYAGYQQQTMCFIDTVMNGSFVIWSVFTIVGISYLARIYLCYGEKLSYNQINLWVAASGVYGFAVSLILIYNPNGGYSLVSSGVYCFINRTSVNIPVGFFLSLIVPFAILVYNLYYVNLAIAASQRLLEAQHMQGQAKGHYTLMVKKLGYFLLSICICEMPMLIDYCIELATGQYVEPDASSIAGILAVSNSAFINPILFIILNVDIQEKFYEKYIMRIISCYLTTRSIIKKQYRSVLPVSDTARDSTGVVSIHSVWNYDYESWELWACDETLKKTFHEYGKKEYVMENFSFYDDIRKFHDMHDSNNKLKYVDGKLVNEMNQDFYRIWDEVNTFVNRLYVIYIKVPTAPLEININTDTRNRLLKVLFKVSESNANINADLSVHSFSSPRHIHEGGSEKRKTPSLVSPRCQFAFSSFKIQDTDTVLSDAVTSICIATETFTINNSNKSNHSKKKHRQHYHNATAYTATAASKALEIKFPDLAKLSIDEVHNLLEEYFTAFDEAFEVISDIIAGDVWPRFRKSNLYETTRKSHQETLGSKV